MPDATPQLVRALIREGTQEAAHLHSHLSIADFLAHSIAARYALAACALPAQDGPEQWRRLRELCADAVQLRRGDQAAERLRLDRDRLARHHQPVEEVVAEYLRCNARTGAVQSAMFQEPARGKLHD